MMESRDEDNFFDKQECSNCHSEQRSLMCRLVGKRCRDCLERKLIDMDVLRETHPELYCKLSDIEVEIVNNAPPNVDIQVLFFRQGDTVFITQARVLKTEHAISETVYAEKRHDIL